MFAASNIQPSEAQSPESTRRLRDAVRQRYPAPQFHMDRYRVIPWKDTFFAVTTDGDVHAVWEIVNGRWSWVFAFTNSQDQGSIDYAFREARFSPRMQAQLGGSRTTPVRYSRF